MRTALGRMALGAAVVVWLLATGILSAWVAGELVAWHRSASSWSRLPIDLAVASVAGLVLAGCAGWLALVTVLAAVEAVTGRSSALLHAATPVVVRRVVAATLGLTFAGAGVVSPAGASGDPCAPPDERHCAGPVDGLPLPDRPLGEAPDDGSAPPRTEPGNAPPPLPVPAPEGPGAPIRPAASVGLPAGTEPAGPTTRSYIVRRGDSLWRIAARQLPPAAPAADVDAGWRRLHRLNRDRIGADPDLLVAGLRLRLPTLSSPPRAVRPDGGTSPGKDQS